MSAQKQITGLQKQNDGMYSSILAKGLTFDRFIINDNISEDDHLQILKDENAKLKELINNNKPPPQVKEPKAQVSQVSQVAKPKSKSKESDENSDQEDYTEPVKKFECITNMEDLKRAFFNNDYEQFNKAVRTEKFPLYIANYKYSSDNDGKPEFAARNLVGGFVRNLEDFRKYLMVCFRCIKVSNDSEPSKYEYISYWIINTNDNLKDVIGTVYEDFEFIKVDNPDLNNPDLNNPDVDKFLELIKRSDENTESSLLVEKYLH